MSSQKIRLVACAHAHAHPHAHAHTQFMHTHEHTHSLFTSHWQTHPSTRTHISTHTLMVTHTHRQWHTHSLALLRKNVIPVFWKCQILSKSFFPSWCFCRFRISICIKICSSQEKLEILTQIKMKSKTLNKKTLTRETLGNGKKTLLGLWFFLATIDKQNRSQLSSIILVIIKK